MEMTICSGHLTEMKIQSLSLTVSKCNSKPSKLLNGSNSDRSEECKESQLMCVDLLQFAKKLNEIVRCAPNFSGLRASTVESVKNHLKGVISEA